MGKYGNKNQSGGHGRTGDHGRTGGHGRTGSNGKKQDPRNKKTNDAQVSGYVGAPYNFVPFTDKIFTCPEDRLPARNMSITGVNADQEELFTGEISYQITAMTPIFVGSGKKPENKRKPEEFYRDNYGRYAIPGSSVRGMIRSNVQILSLSSIGDDVDDYALMYRQVAGGASTLKERYETILGAGEEKLADGGSISVLKNVQAGYIKQEQGSYYIYHTTSDKTDDITGKKNYHVLSERTIAEEYASLAPDKEFAYQFLYDGKGKNLLAHDISKGFEKDETKEPVQYKGTKNEAYTPFELPCSYRLSGRKVTAVGKPEEYEAEGYVVGTGKMFGKKAVYIIPQIDMEKDAIPVPKEDIRAFQIDLRRRETTLKNFGGKVHFDLPQEGEMRPVFYIYEGGHLYFGFTPHLRLFYDFTIHDGIPAEHFSGVLDHAKALFGYSGDTSSYKSRVSFSDAVVTGDSDGRLERVDAILAEPKPTSYHDYVQPHRGKATDYNQEDFRLRGVKQYWLRNKARSVVEEDKKDKAFVSHFNALAEGTRFVGKIRYQNLTMAELGLLLWGLKLNDNAWMNIGKAKAFGYGNILLDLAEVKNVDQDSAYSLSTLALHPWQDVDVDSAIDVYKAQLKEFLGGKDPEKVDPIKTLLSMKDSESIPDPRHIRFMKINANEYQSRERPLDTAAMVLVKSGIGKKSEDYEAVVKEVDGKRVKFYCEELQKYGYFKLEQIHIEGLEVTRGNIQSEFPVGSRIRVACSTQGDTTKWECIAK